MGVMDAPEEKRPSSWAIPPEHAITRRYMLPPGAAAEFIAELEDETEEPTAALRALLSGFVR
jgi:hypothetical protein